jgi:hypothetical protein
MRVSRVKSLSICTQSQATNIATLPRSGTRPYSNVTFQDVDLRRVNSTPGLPMYGTNLQNEVFQCGNIIGKTNSGIPCNHVAPNNFSQGVYANVKN